MGSTLHIGTTVMIPVGFLDTFDAFVDERGTDRSKEIRAAYRDLIEHPPPVETVEELNDEIDGPLPRPTTKVMLDPDLLRRDMAFREGDPDDPDDDGRGTDRSEEICAAMARHLDDPLDVLDVTDSLVAQVRERGGMDMDADARGV
jgi:hypothetical protein